MLRAREHYNDDYQLLSIEECLFELWGLQPSGYMHLGIRWGERGLRPVVVDGRSKDWRERVGRRLTKYDGQDLFWRVSTFKGRKGIKENANPTRLLHCDIDEGDAGRAWVFPSLLYMTSPGRHQAVWILDEEISPQEAEAYNRTLAHDCSVDGSGADCTKFLRVPYTINTKRGKPFTGDVIHADLTPIKTRPRATPAPLGHRGGSCPVDWAEVGRMVPADVVYMFPRVRHLLVGGLDDRSARMSLIIWDMARRGTPEEIACLVCDSEAGESRIRSRGRASVRRWVEDEIAKARVKRGIKL